MPDAKLRKKHVDGSSLHAVPAAGIAKFSGIDMILPIRSDYRNAAKAVHDDLGLPGSAETLQEFLQYQACGDDRLASGERNFQRGNLGNIRH